MMRSVILVILTSLALATSASADNRFHPLPGRGSNVQLRVVQYDGATNGELTVQVKNRGAEPVRFSASGLYFVPDGDPNSAPQRLGAVGPMQIATDREGARRTAVLIPAGKTVEVTLDVFCIDSHRSSPSSSTPFTVARNRMPASLAKQIDVAGAKAAKAAGGFAAPAAKDKIQGEVWRTRDSKWVDLDGEGAQEADK